MGSISENNVNNKQILRKPARQLNPVVYRKLRRGSNATRVPEKQNESQPEKAVLPYNKTDDNNESEEWITRVEDKRDFVFHDEKGKLEVEMSIPKSSNSSYIKKQKKKNGNIVDKAIPNKEIGVTRSLSHVIYVKDTIQTSDCNQEQQLTQKFQPSCKSFIQFCSTEIICPQQDRSALAIKLYGIQAALLSALGNPFENLTQSMTSKTSSQIVVVSIAKAFTGFLPAMIWTGIITLSFFYTVMVVWSLAFRVPLISMLCLSLLYCLSVLVAAASGFNVVWGTFRINGILFASLGVLSFVMILLVLVTFVLFACWRVRTDQDEGGSK